MINDTCAAAAAYVLGSLSATGRSEFEEHLAGCGDCQATVRELAGLPGLLSRVSSADLDQPPVPSTLVPGLLRVVRRRQLRRRLTVGALAAAAVILAVLGTVAVLTRPAAEPPATAMTQLVESPIHATVRMVEQDEGTRIQLDCRYEGGAAGVPAWPYALVVVDDGGDVHELATWLIGPDGKTSVSGSVALRPEEIADIEIRTGDGRPLLRLDGSRAR